MKATLLALGLLACFPAIAFTQSPVDKALLERLEKGPDKVQALQSVLKRSDELLPSVLDAAIPVAVQEKRFEDATFLLYARLFRADFDDECFPPKGLTGLRPFIVDSLTAKLLLPTLTRAAMHEPVALTNVVARLKKWQPKVTKDYHPGYEFTERKSEKAALEATKASRTKILAILTDVSILLQDAEYFAAFRVNQTFNHASEDKRPTKEENDEAIKTMKRIEKDKGVKTSLIE